MWSNTASNNLMREAESCVIGNRGCSFYHAILAHRFTIYYRLARLHSQGWFAFCISLNQSSHNVNMLLTQA
jgi:hypothetical protein